MDAKIAGLQKTIKERVKESNSIARANRGKKPVYWLMLFSVVLFGSLNIGASIRSYLKARSLNSDFWVYFFIGIALFVQSLIWRSMLIPPPQRKQDFEKWVWKGYREQALYWGIVYLFITIASLLSPILFGKYQYIIAGSYFAFVLFILSVVAVLISPKLFMSGFIGGIGKIAYWTFLLFMPLRVIIGFFRFVKTSEITVLIVSVSLFVIFLPLYLGNKDRKLNEVQYYSVRILDPNKLLLTIGMCQ